MAEPTSSPDEIRALLRSNDAERERLLQQLAEAEADSVADLEAARRGEGSQDLEDWT